jgi:hypothetical protein
VNAGADSGADAGVDACLARTCADYGATCGSPSDGCGGVIASCGTCKSGDHCNDFACCTPGPQFSALVATTAVGDLTWAVGTHAWTNPANAKLSDNATADVTGMAAGDVTDYLFAEGFGLNVPTNATILGIEVHIRRKSVAGGIADEQVVLFVSGSYAGANHADKNTLWGTSFTTAVYGGLSDLWGSAWTPAALNNAQFGVGLAVHASAANDAPNVDVIQVQVTYSLPCP